LQPENYKSVSAMKKSIIIIVFALVSFLTSSAQDYKTSGGLRAGVPFGPNGLTIRHFLDKKNAVEGILAVNGFNGIIATGLYENEHWTGYYPGLNWYWGVGAHVGFWDAGTSRYFNSSYTGGGVVGVDGVFGVEYTFDEIPLNISVDILPSVNLFGYAGWNGISSGISARYVF
jgi:hypothetical protein